jgi:hypothetical protein
MSALPAWKFFSGPGIFFSSLFLSLGYYLPSSFPALLVSCLGHVHLERSHEARSLLYILFLSFFFLLGYDKRGVHGSDLNQRVEQKNALEIRGSLH